MYERCVHCDNNGVCKSWKDDAGWMPALEGWRWGRIRGPAFTAGELRPVSIFSFFLFVLLQRVFPSHCWPTHTNTDTHKQTYMAKYHQPKPFCSCLKLRQGKEQKDIYGRERGKERKVILKTPDTTGCCWSIPMHQERKKYSKTYFLIGGQMTGRLYSSHKYTQRCTLTVSQTKKM